MSLSNTTSSGLPTINTCPGASAFVLSQVQHGYVVNVTFEGAKPPLRVTGTPLRNGTAQTDSQCQVFLYNWPSNSFLWPVTTNTPNATAISGFTKTPPSEYFNSIRIGNATTPIFQLGDSVQWTAHELTTQSDGSHKYYQSQRYAITLEDGGTTPTSASVRSAGLRVAQTGVVGWLIGCLLLCGGAALRP